MVIDIPIAVALGFDEPSGTVMGRPPRPVGAPVLSRANWVRLCVQGAVMTIGALAAYQLGHTQTDDPTVAATMLLTALSLSHVAAGLLARDQHNTIFARSAIPGPTQLRRYGIALLAIIAVTTIGILQQTLRHHRAQPRPMVDLHRHRRHPDHHRRTHQTRHPPPPPPNTTTPTEPALSGA